VTPEFSYLLALGIGIVAGLRSLTAPAAVSWAAHLDWLDLHGSIFSFMGSTTPVAIFSLLAAAEFVGDVLPRTPRRTLPGPLAARVLSGGLSAACLVTSSDRSLIIGVLLGGIGAVIGAYAGYETRRRAVAGLRVKDVMVAVPEDVVAVALAYLIVSRH
jgi:uncharacterized membrane protein